MNIQKQTFQDAATATGDGNTLAVGEAGGVSFQVTGTFVGVIVFEATIDGTNWVPISVKNKLHGTHQSNATSPGICVAGVAGLHGVRARISEYTSGNITVTGLSSNENEAGEPTHDPWIEHAKRIIYADDGVHVTLDAKNQDLLKFGRNKLVGTAEATVMTLPVGEVHETYVSTNLINSIISDNLGDTEVMVIEGQTVISNVFTFVLQTVTLTGQTVAALSTPLARVTRIYPDGGTNLIGNVYVTETDTYSSGVPNTAAKTHLTLVAGSNQSWKASTTLSSVDYWLITRIYGDLLEKTAAFASFSLQIRLPGKVFRDVVHLSSGRHHPFQPYIIAKPNSDIRLVSIADGASTDVSGGIEGVLLKA